MTFSQTTYTAPSGAFTPAVSSPTSDSIPGSVAPVYNPSVLDDYTASYGTKKTFELGSKELSRAAEHYRTVTADHFKCYSQRLLELTNQIVSFAPHCSLAPLRGAAKPCVTAEVMSKGACLYDYFYFRENSNKAEHPRFIADLTEILVRRDPGQEEYRINVTDTSRGGHGITNLIPLMAGVKASVPRFKRQNWLLDLNLFNDSTEESSIARIDSVRDLNVPGAVIRLHLYKVPYLIVEDFTPALTFDQEWDGRRRIFLPRSIPGQFLYQTANQAILIQTDNSYLTFEELFSRYITEYLITAQNMRQVGVVWQEYQNK